MKKNIKWAALVAASLVLASCNTVPETYIQADRELYDVLAPAHRAYVTADAALDAEQRARRLRLLDAWELRIRQAEGAR